MKLLVINPGSTSTKIALFEGTQSVYVKTVRHDVPTINLFPQSLPSWTSGWT